MGSESDRQGAADKQQHASYLDSAIDSVWRRDPNATTPQPQDYLKDLIKTVPLFMGGRVALMGASALGALDQARPGDSAGTQAVDGFLGAVKGAATKRAFDGLGAMPTNFVVKGVAMGMTARTLDVGFTRQTYFDNNGDFSIGHGVWNVAGTAFGPKALAGDMVTAGMGLGAMRGLEKLGVGRLQESRLFSNVANGTIFGGSTGMYQEFQRQTAEGKFDPLGIAKETFIHAGVGGLGAAPGGFQAALKYRVSDFGPVPLEQSQANLARMRDPIETTGKAPEQVDPNRRWESQAQFFNEGLRMGDQSVRQYSIDGHTTKLQIPIAYDNALPGIRQMRATASEPLFADNVLNLAHTLRVAGARIQNDFSPLRGRYLPEDLIRGLDQTPDSSLINSIMASPNEPPYSYRVGRFRQRNDAIAEMFQDNRFLFFRPPEGWHPDNTFLHEWSHIQQRDNKSAFAAYHAALKLEEYGWDNHDYAKKNVFENWSVNSEPLLGADPVAFKRLVDMAPLRSVVLGRALEESLSVVPPERRPVNYDMLMQRVEYIKENALPNARRMMNAGGSRGATGDHLNAMTVMEEFLAGKIDGKRADDILKMDWQYDYYR